MLHREHAIVEDWGRTNKAGYGPRYTSGPKKGQCNMSPNAPELAKGAVASFLLSAVLRLP